MADTGRKDMGTKAKETMQPDSTKSTYDKVTESASGAADKISRYVHPVPLIIFYIPNLFP